MRHLIGPIWIALCLAGCADATLDATATDATTNTIDDADLNDADGGVDEMCHECAPCACPDGHVFSDEACWEGALPHGLCHVDRDPTRPNFEIHCAAACAEREGGAVDAQLDASVGSPRDAEALPDATPPLRDVALIEDAAPLDPDAAPPPVDAAPPPVDAAPPPVDAAPPPAAAPCPETLCARRGWGAGWRCDGDRRVRCEVVDGCVIDAESSDCDGETPRCEPQSAACVACIEGEDCPPPCGDMCDEIDPSLIDACEWSDGAALGWPITVPLRDLNLHWAAHFGPYGPYLDISPADYQAAFETYYPFGPDLEAAGHIWIFVRQPDSARWWGAVFEGLSPHQTLHAGANLNFEHQNVLAPTPLAAPWQPTPGETYGFMISTAAFAPWGPQTNGEQRSNILLATWPAP